MRRLVVLVLPLLLASGCVSLDAAQVPKRLLNGTTGWVEDRAASAGPESEGLFAKTATRAYKDTGQGGSGYPAVLTVYSFRTTISPDAQGLKDRTQEFLEDQAGSQGFVLQGSAREGSRAVAGGRPSDYFVFSAKATERSELFARDSTVKVLGEVFRCPSGANVIVAASAQVNTARTIGGILTQQDPDETNWAEIVSDPDGSIDGRRGQNGLVFNIEC